LGQLCTRNDTSFFKGDAALRVMGSIGAVLDAVNQPDDGNRWTRDTSLAEQSAWPDVSVIVPVFNDEIRLHKCIRSLLGQTYTGAVEIIVVDNGSPGGLESLKAEFPTVAFLNDERIGSYNARNTGIAHARGEVLAFTDSDCDPTREWLQTGVQALLREGGNTIVGGRIAVFPVNTQRPRISELYDIATGFRQGIYVKWHGSSATGNLLAYRSTFDAVGRFNGRLRSGGDGEWCQRAARAGYRLIYEDGAVIRHPARTTHEEIIARVRRTEAGRRDLFPSWYGCIREVLRCLAPPVIETYMLLWGQGRNLKRHHKILVFAYAWQVRWISAWERLKFQFDTSKSPRA